MVLSLVGLMCGITAPVGLVMGIISLKRIKKSPTTVGGKGFAITGIAVGGVVTALMVLYIVVMVVAVAATSPR